MIADAAEDELARDGRTRIGQYEERSFSVTVNVISILVAAVLLIGAISSFYVVHSDNAKLGMIAVFTAVFALSVMFLTKSSRAEIFRWNCSVSGSREVRRRHKLVNHFQDMLPFLLCLSARIFRTRLGVHLEAHHEPDSSGP